MIQHIITLNFDVLIEEALNNDSVGYEVLTPKNEWKINQRFGNHATIYKPHGSLPLEEQEQEVKYDDLIKTITEIQQNPLAKVENIIIEKRRGCSILLALVQKN